MTDALQSLAIIVLSITLVLQQRRIIQLRDHLIIVAELGLTTARRITGQQE